MKRMILFFIIFDFAVIASSQIVNIPDANFKAALVGNTNINTNGDSEIQVSEALATQNIVINSQNISDLTGIEEFANIVFLSCYNNQLTSLQLDNNQNLKKLICGYNQLSELILGNNSILDTLICSSNNLTTLDISNNIGITYLDCHYNDIASLDVSANVNLKTLICSENQLSSIDVTTNPNLMLFWCFGNNISELNLENNIELVDLDCSYNQIQVLDLTNNINLNSITCNENLLSELDLSSNVQLGNTENIVGLDCSNNLLTYLNVKNGNNSNFTAWFYSLNNPELYCIQVDDSEWSTTNWIGIDSQSFFSEDCSASDVNQFLDVDFAVFPNPILESFSLSCNKYNLGEIHVRIYNVLGEEISFSKTTNENTMIINSENWKSGLYTISVELNGEFISRLKIAK
jgi:hypothetical protein